MDGYPCAQPMMHFLVNSEERDVACVMQKRRLDKLASEIAACKNKIRVIGELAATKKYGDGKFSCLHCGQPGHTNFKHKACLVYKGGVPADKAAVLTGAVAIPQVAKGRGSRGGRGGAPRKARPSGPSGRGRGRGRGRSRKESSSDESSSDDSSSSDPPAHNDRATASLAARPSHSYPTRTRSFTPLHPGLGH